MTSSIVLRARFIGSPYLLILDGKKEDRIPQNYYCARVEGPGWMRAVYKRLRTVVEGFNGRAKSRLAYERLTWQGLENASTHVSLVLMVVYAVCIAAYGIRRPELWQSMAFFA